MVPPGASTERTQPGGALSAFPSPGEDARRPAAPQAEKGEKSGQAPVSHCWQEAAFRSRAQKGKLREERSGHRFQGKE